MKVKRLHDEVVTLKTAIEEAIREGQKSTDDLKDIPRSGRVSKRTLPSPAWTQVRGLSAGSTIFELTPQYSSTSQRTLWASALSVYPLRNDGCTLYFLTCTKWRFVTFWLHNISWTPHKKLLTNFLVNAILREVIFIGVLQCQRNLYVC